MPLARCSGRGGLLVVRNRPMDIKPGWMGVVTEDVLATSPFLEPVEDWPSDAYVIADELTEDEEP